MNVERIKRKLLQDVQKLRSQKGYLNAGYPRYYSLFGRDALISAWQTLKIDPSIARAALQVLAEYQGKQVNSRAEEEPGKILHEYQFSSEQWMERPDWEFPYYGSVDSTPLFIILAGKYLHQTHDKNFLLKTWENLLAAFRWIIDYGDGDEDGYVEYERGTPNGLFHQGWRDSIDDDLGIKPPVAIVEAQGYVYAAYQTLISLSRQLGKNNIYRQASSRLEVLRRRFNKDFWMEKKRYFALALDAEKRRREAITSNPGHLLFTGVVILNKINPLVSQLFGSGLWTPYGIRTHSCEEWDFDPYSYHMGSVWPHDNWIIYKGLQKLGLSHHADRIKKALLQAYKELGHIPELYAVVDGKIVDLSAFPTRIANPMAAWASAGLLEMIWNN
ncbi:MAG: amylo-alpha-1,6-glucosidase [Thermoproteota archaeon]|nr:amylo-alpha-1,6-glucosidase [Thermoproteota archaeon]